MKEINWQTESSSASENHISSRFIELCRDNFVTQHVTEYTRYRENTQPSILDLILSNSEIVGKIENCAPLGSSDHVTLCFKLHVNIVYNYELRSKKLFFKADYEEINEMIKRMDWEISLEETSMNDAWNTFKSKISQIVKETIPEKAAKPGSKYYQTPWMTDEAREAIKSKRKAWRKLIYCPNLYNHHIYKVARNNASGKIKKAKREYEQSIANNVKKDPKTFWKYVKTKTKIKDSIKNLRDSDDKIIDDQTKKANLLNNYFTSVFTKEDLDNIPIFDDRNFNTELVDISFNDEEIEKLFEKLDPKKSQGIDELHPKLLKETAATISKPISQLFKLSFEQSQLPTDWKNANITAIHKKGDKDLPSNYRPISLTSIVCKTMEKLIRDEIVRHMETNNLFTKHQYGFRKGYSCATQLIGVIDEWTRLLDNRDEIDVIYLDFQKAFDTVPHARLLNKLYAYGIRGKVHAWLKEYLNQRKQRVILNGEKSGWAEVTSGIPQGTVLGPILFLIYINDLPEVVTNAVKLFADDTKLYGKSNNNQDHSSLQQDICNLLDWSDRWQLKFNPQKCKHCDAPRRIITARCLHDGGCPNRTNNGRKRSGHSDRQQAKIHRTHSSFGQNSKSKTWNH
ncbi:hypothetical protein FSP39_004535 [Pinctada imbricata]|uniref:Reverse transcriptase domain-containing protein n=1 Tax=Pinctada imbricata TaxID=66713 RepID=A0AA89C6G8_PINIB|nr:hypothetical protein FSP39_004535 [Pinctada imbricata]